MALPEDRARAIATSYVLAEIEGGRGLADIADGRRQLAEASRDGELVDVAEWICAEFAGLWMAFAEQVGQPPADLWRRFRIADAADMGGDDG